MKNSIFQKLALYIYNHFLGNFLGFIVAIASMRIVSHFFATRSIKNLWGLTAKKIVVDRQTFSTLELTISILIGFIVFELISKTVKKKMDEKIPSWKNLLKSWMNKNTLLNHTTSPVSYQDKDAATAHTRQSRVYRDVQ